MLKLIIAKKDVILIPFTNYKFISVIYYYTSSLEQKHHFHM